MRGPGITVVETGEYLARAAGLLTEEERARAVKMIALDPTCGDVMPGCGGVRKVRFAIGGRGKSGGVRILYYYYNETKPVFLLSVFAKKDKANVSAAERNALAAVAKVLIEKYGAKR